jgi:hypothetical protein
VTKLVDVLFGILLGGPANILSIISIGYRISSLQCSIRHARLISLYVFPLPTGISTHTI